MGSSPSPLFSVRPGSGAGESAERLVMMLLSALGGLDTGEDALGATVEGPSRATVLSPAFSPGAVLSWEGLDASFLAGSGVAVLSLAFTGVSAVEEGLDLAFAFALGAAGFFGGAFAGAGGSGVAVSTAAFTGASTFTGALAFSGGVALAAGVLAFAAVLAFGSGAGGDFLAGGAGATLFFAILAFSGGVLAFGSAGLDSARSAGFEAPSLAPSPAANGGPGSTGCAGAPVSVATFSAATLPAEGRGRTTTGIGRPNRSWYGPPPSANQPITPAAAASNSTDVIARALSPYFGASGEFSWLIPKVLDNDP